MFDFGNASYFDENVLISGAGGSIGSELCRQILVCRPSKLVLFEQSELALYNIEMELREQAEDAQVQLVPVLGSVDDGPLVEHILDREDINIILHAAAYKHVPLVEANPLVGLANNVFGTSTLAS
jgi:FlaA1/EpsC-like NDP-sugar epimerase